MTDTKLGLIQRLADALEGHIDHVPAYKEEVAEEQADLIDQARAFLAQPEPEGPTDEDRIKAAFVMGQTGAPSSETERLAFESWMRGHSWLVEGVWDGTTYDDRGPSRVSWVDVGAMQTRMLWAVWRDRAAMGA